MRWKLGGTIAALSLLAVVPALSLAKGDGGQTAHLAASRGLPRTVACSKLTGNSKHQPVLLVSGYGTTSKTDFGRNLLKSLVKQGYPTCTVDPPGHMLGDIQATGEQVAVAVRAISARTGGGKVDIVAHSEGAASSRWAIKWWPDVRAKVDDLVTLAGGNHGLPMLKPACALGRCTPAARQLQSGSRFFSALNSGDETPGHVDVTSIYSVTDELVQPFTLSRVKGATNISVQSVCPVRVALHGGILFDAVAFALVTDALDHPGAAKPSRISRFTCLKLLAPGVGAGDLAAFMAKDAPSVLGTVLGGRRAGSEPPLKRYARR